MSCCRYNVSGFLHSLGHDVFILSMPLKGTQRHACCCRVCALGRLPWHVLPLTMVTMLRGGNTARSISNDRVLCVASNTRTRTRTHTHTRRHQPRPRHHGHGTQLEPLVVPAVGGQGRRRAALLPRAVRPHRQLRNGERVHRRLHGRSQRRRLVHHICTTPFEIPLLFHFFFSFK